MQLTYVTSLCFTAGDAIYIDMLLYRVETIVLDSLHISNVSGGSRAVSIQGQVAPFLLDSASMYLRWSHKQSFCLFHHRSEEIGFTYKFNLL